MFKTFAKEQRSEIIFVSPKKK